MSAKNRIPNNSVQISQSQVGKERGSWSIPTPEEFDFYQCLKFLGRSSQERLHFIEKKTLRKLIKFEDEILLLELDVDSAGDLRIVILNGRVHHALRQFVDEFVSEWFDLDTDLRPFYQLAMADPILKELVDKFYGLRLVRIHNLFQALCWAILGQQINLAFAYTLYRRFIERYGEKAILQSRDYWLFPEARIIATLSVVELMKLQLTGKKAEYIIGIAQQIADGILSKKALMDCDDSQDAKNKLTAIRGIGPWTANYVLMRCLGHRSAFPIEDIGLHNAIKNQLNLKDKPSIDDIRKLSRGWKNWEAYATFYLYATYL